MTGADASPITNNVNSDTYKNMKKAYLTIAGLAVAFGAAAQINSPTAAGHISRSEAYIAQENYQAALDQLRTVDVDGLSADLVQRTHILRAEALYGSGDYAAARMAFAEYAVAYPAALDREDAVCRVADCVYAGGHYAEALELYASVRRDALTDARRARLAYNMGYCAYMLGRTDEARKYFAQAEADGATRSAARFYLGVIAFDGGDYAEARRLFQSVNAAEAPGNMAGYYIAEIDFTDGAWSKAAAEARRQLRLTSLSAPMRAEMMRVLGESQYRMGERADGIANLRRYLAECDAPRPSALYLVALADYETAEYASALGLLQRVVDDESADEALTQSAYLYIGQILLHDGDNAAALLAFDKATKSEADAGVREAAFYNYAVAKFSGASLPFASSADTFEEFIRLYPSGPYSDRVREYLVSGYVADNDYDRALERLNAITNPGANILKAKQQILYALGSKAFAAGDMRAANRYLDEAATLARHDAATAAEVTLLRAETALADGRYSEAADRFRAYLNSAGRNAANRPTALYGLGYALFNQKEYAEAAKYFSQIAATPLSPAAKADALNRLGDISYYGSDFASAADRYTEAYRTDPAAGDYAAFNLARMKGYQSEYQEKLDALAEFGREFPSSALLPDALLETTQAQINLGRNADAVETYRKLISTYPHTAQGRRGYLQMALTLLDMNRRSDAIEAYKGVISNYPSSDEAAQASTLLKNLYAEDGRADEYLAFMASVDNAPRISEDEAQRLSYESAVKNLNDAISADHARALSLAVAMLERYPDTAGAETALLLLADDDYAEGRIPEALARYQELEHKASDAATVGAARLGIMRSARDMGDNELAGATAEAILASSASAPAVSEARFTSALALDAADRTDEAIAIWTDLAARPAELYGAKSAVYAAEALLEQGKAADALKLAQTFTSAGSPHRYWVARGFIVMADAYRAQGKKFEAKEYLEALRDNYPGNETDIVNMIETRLSEL